MCGVKPDYHALGKWSVPVRLREVAEPSIRPSLLKLRNEGPIGVFDSGLGGLGVLHALSRRLPLEDFVYLADTARNPYGTRGKQTIFNYCHACARALRDHRIKLLVLTCHTASAVAQERLAAELFMPVVGGLTPGLQAGLATGAPRIGVLTSTYLSRSGDWTRALTQLSPQTGLRAQNSQLLCAMLDDGEFSGELLRLAIKQQLAPMLESKVQTVVLGESPLAAIRGEVEAVGGGAVRVVDATEHMVESVLQLVEAKQLATSRTDPGKLRVVFTDPPEDMRIAERYFGRSFSGVTVASVDL
jgi:glutamate racemase